MSITICPHCKHNLDPLEDSIYCEECGGNIFRAPAETKVNLVERLENALFSANSCQINMDEDNMNEAYTDVENAVGIIHEALVLVKGENYK